MKLLELFDSPTQYNWIKKTDTLWKGQFKAGESLFNFTADFRLHDEQDGMIWEIFFKNETADGNKYEITNSGNEVAVFSTVFAMLKEFAGTVQPDLILVGAAIKEPSRVKLYSRMAKRAGLVGYTFAEEYTEDETDHIFVFKKNSAIDEDLAFNTGFIKVDKFLDRMTHGDKYKNAIVYYLQLLQKFPGKSVHHRHDVLKQAAKHTGLNFRQLEEILHKAIGAGDLPQHLAYRKDLL